MGGEAAAARLSDILNPERATLHLFEGAGPLPHRLFLPDVGGNIDVVQGFGSELDWSGEAVMAGGEPFAHPLLVYAELLARDGQDRRVREAAEKLRVKFDLDGETGGDARV